MSFSWNDQLTQHIRLVHEKRKPYKCSDCSEAFTLRHHLTKHEKVFHTSYECKTCDMAGGGYSICTLCITTCHADHDVKYKRHGPHFCDCGAEGEKSCFSLVKKQTGKLFTFSNCF